MRRCRLLLQFAMRNYAPKYIADQGLLPARPSRIGKNRLTPDVRERLLASIRAARLVVVCGAGLSMAPPSNLPSAQRVAELCHDEYRQTVEPNINPDLRGDLQGIAEYFYDLNLLQNIFIKEIVPWSSFVCLPNSGHKAIADFLVSRAVEAGISTNYDTLIERCAVDYGFDFQSALDGDEAISQTNRQGPLLKLHGCSNKDRASTIWTPLQIPEQPISDRLQKSTNWMNTNLRQKDLLIVGFWSDWHYLNQIFSSALPTLTPISVTVIDQSDGQQLQQKAPDLWDAMNADGISFHHVQESAADALDELRRAFSGNYLRQMFEAGRYPLQQQSGAGCDPAWFKVGNLDSEALYGWRRDAEGVPCSKPATKKQPENSELLGFFHLLLRQAGANAHRTGYDVNGRTIRVINGRGASLSTLRSEFIEPPAVVTADMIVAVTATDLGSPDNVVRSGRAGDFIRPEPVAEWYDMDGARKVLGI